MNADPVLERILESTSFPTKSLEANSDVIFVLDRRHRIAYCNPAWDAFAKQNHGIHLERNEMVGRDCLQGVPDFLRNWYKKLYRWVRKNQKPWEHDYQCSSPQKFRAFHMRVLPIDRSYLLVENSLLIERAHRWKLNLSSDRQYINQYGWIVMCAHCRRTEYMCEEGKREWHWVPSYIVKAPAPVSGGICPACVSYYFRLTLHCR
jgi:PAS domain-containing protein